MKTIGFKVDIVSYAKNEMNSKGFKIISEGIKFQIKESQIKIYFNKLVEMKTPIMKDIIIDKYGIIEEFIDKIEKVIIDYLSQKVKLNDKQKQAKIIYRRIS